MPRDYKNRSQATRKEPKKRTGLPPWKSAMGGFVAGLVVAMGAYVEGRYPGTIVAFNAPEFPVPDAVAMADVPPEKTERRKPKFEFYTLLPEVEVEVVEEPEPLRKTKAEKEREQQAQRAAKQIAAQRAEETTSINTLVRVVTPKPAEPLKTKAVKHSVQPEPGVKAYMLQVGSFRELADADRLRAKLTLGGHQALIQSVAGRGSELWHRVRLGPYGDLVSAERARAKLAMSQLNAMVLKIRS